MTTMTGTQRADGYSATRRTALALLAGCLGAVPLKTLLSDNVWLFEAWVTMAIVVAPAALLRLRRAPSALDIWPGIILLVPWLTRMFVPHHAWGGFIPSGRSFTDVSNLMDSLHHTTRDEVAPIHSTVAVRLVLCALLGLLTALIDLIAVVGRRGALAGVPLLVVYTVSGAVPRTPVAWAWFAIAAAGYLVLLSLDAADELREWGRRVARRGGSDGRPVLAFSAPRIGLIAIVVAIVLPMAVPAHPRNLIADAFHSGNGGGLGSFGAGTGGGSISPFAALKGQLDRTRPVPLMSVNIQSNAPVQPFYMRSNILDTFTGSGWRVDGSGHGDTEQLDVTAFPTEPPAATPRATSFIAHVTISGLTGNAPVFTLPRSITGLQEGTGWSPQDQLLLGPSVHDGEQFTEDVIQPEPSAADLAAAPQVSAPDMSHWLQLPGIPAYVVNLVKTITAGKTSPYDKARAISDWFANPANAFVYSLKTAKGDSGNDLVDFLQHRQGYCQQYAAAMGVMLRLAGVPSRVVLGYMHDPPNSQGDFTITTFDAHAWVEAFFPGAGWIPFDPTPTTGLVGGKKTDLAWAPHSYGGSAAGISPFKPPHSTGAAQPNNPTPSASQGATAIGSGSSFSSLPLIWAAVVALGLALMLFAPWAVRSGRRRRRYAAARRGDPDPLWAELSDTAVDLGYVWSQARTPRQVSDWLARDAADTAPALHALAVAVEQRRYARSFAGVDADRLARGLQDVTDQLRAVRRGRIRLVSRLWPASLGWGTRVRTVRAKLRRRH